MRRIMFGAVLAGCAGAPPEGEDIHALLDRYLFWAERAEATKTHATGEHPAALREMRAVEGELRARCASAEGSRRLREAMDMLLARIRERRLALERRRQAAAESDDPAERQWLETGYAREMEALKFQEDTLRSLDDLLPPGQ